jgi:hypothetical protein
MGYSSIPYVIGESKLQPGKKVKGKPFVVEFCAENR